MRTLFLPSPASEGVLATRPCHLLTGDVVYSCDGVIWEGDHVIGKAKETLQFLRKEGKRVFFVTNNATKSRKANKGKFDKMGIQCEEVRLAVCQSRLVQASRF